MLRGGVWNVSLDALVKRTVGRKGGGVSFPTMEQTELRNYGVPRVYETKRGDGEGVALRLRDRVVELGGKELGAYQKLAEWLPTIKPVGEIVAPPGMERARVK